MKEAILLTDGYKLDHRRQYPENSVKYRVIQFPDGEPHIVLENIDRKDNLSVLCNSHG